jgi:Cu2+-containing amine oxidase
MKTTDATPGRPCGLARITTLVAMGLGCLAAGSASLVHAQDESVAPLVEPADSLGKDLLTPEGHCSPNNQTVTFGGITTWDLCFSAVSRYGLIIQLAEFQKSPTAAPVRVLFDGRFSEIFVPYHPGQPRFFDIGQNNAPLLQLSAADCPAPRTIIGGGRVCREVRDRGLAWKDDALVRRGEELVLWSVLDAGNYNYIMEWAFRDDGSIGARAGSTGPKLGGPNDTRGHMHAFTWRLDFDINGAMGDSVYRTAHKENLQNNPSNATDSATLIQVEAGQGWAVREFTTWEIGDDTLQNGNGRHTHYELVPYRTGTGRHTEAFTKQVFWVTAANPNQLLAMNLPNFLNGQDVSSADVVVWYTGTGHHEDGMRDEDRDTVPVIWTGFEIVPKNMFETTPFFP